MKVFGGRFSPFISVFVIVGAFSIICSFSYAEFGVCAAVVCFGTLLWDDLREIEKKIDDLDKKITELSEE